MARPGTTAMRLTFVHRNGSLQLQSRIGVDAVVPPGDAAAVGAERGFWAELLDSTDRSLFRRVLHDPLPNDREVFTQDPGRSIARAPGARADQVFSVLVPNVPAAVAVVLYSSHHQPVTVAATSKGAARSSAVDLQPIEHAAQVRARMIARFSLDATG